MHVRKIIYTFLYFQTFILACFSQSKSSNPGINLKRLIDSSTYSNWPSVIEEDISNDGKFACYSIENEPKGFRTGVVMSLRNKWKFVIPYISGRITICSGFRIALWINNNDSLCIIKLGTSEVSYIPNVSSFEIKENSLFYRLKGPGNNLVRRCMKTAELRFYSSVSLYKVSLNGEILVLLQTSKEEKEFTQEVNIVNVRGNEFHNIWKGVDINSITMDEEGKQLAFIGVDRMYKKKAIWYYKLSDRESLKCLAKDSSEGIPGGGKIGEIIRFSKDGGQIFFTLTEGDPARSESAKDAIQVDIWNYNDQKLQSHQMSSPISRNYTGAIRVGTDKVFQLEYTDEWLALPNTTYVSDTFALIRKQQNDGMGGEIKWNVSCRIYWYLISTINGSRKLLSFVEGNNLVELSPSQKYIIYFNKELNNYFSYEIKSSKIRNITQGINEFWGNDIKSEYYRYRSIGGWEQDDATVIIYGQNDIWQIDPAGIIPPVNLTNAYGREHNFVFTLAIDPYNQRYLSRNEVLLFSAFNQETKESGFYKKKLGTIGNPDSLTMGPYIYDVAGNQSIQSIYNFCPLKARSAKRYIVKRMSATEAPNYFTTSDFKKFRAISRMQPQEAYNWYTSELHNWESINGTKIKGILYKPENFDSLHRYPVIIHYYEKKSDGLNAYLIPEALSEACNISIPYYVSNGYLVFCPDIHYVIGDPMEGTYESIVSAALHLAKIPFVNAKKIALQGCSWGGIQTNYLVTKTSLFAAACSASGIADWISSYGSILGYGASLQGMYEIGQFRMGGTLWEITNKYIENSPILYANKISTPILLMHTKDDGICSFSNAIEFFTALRRLRKRSWMLVYEGNHGVLGNEAKDYSIRMKQFFDHYLKDSLPPIWMTRGVPANQRGFTTGLALDDSCKNPRPELVTDTL